MWHVGSQVQELKKLVLANKEALVALRTNFDKPDVMKELAKRLVHVDSVLQVQVGISLCAMGTGGIVGSVEHLCAVLKILFFFSTSLS